MVAQSGVFSRDSATPGGAARIGGGYCPSMRKFSRLTVLSGPSGVGKSTVIAELRRFCPELWLSVSVTTRSPRAGEVNGREYFFVDDKEFDRMVDEGELLEWAEFAGNKYGTPRNPLEEKLAAGIPCLLEIDLEGARQVRRSMPDARLVFLAPPSWAELVRRLTAARDRAARGCAAAPGCGAPRAGCGERIRHHAGQHVRPGGVPPGGSLGFRLG